MSPSGSITYEKHDDTCTMYMYADNEPTDLKRIQHAHVDEVDCWKTGVRPSHNKMSLENCHILGWSHVVISQAYRGVHRTLTCLSDRWRSRSTLMTVRSIALQDVEERTPNFILRSVPLGLGTVTTVWCNRQDIPLWVQEQQRRVPNRVCQVLHKTHSAEFGTGLETLQSVGS